MTFADLERVLGHAGFRLAERPAVSAQRFADGARYRIEIPSVEGPAVFRALLDHAAASCVRRAELCLHLLR